MSLQAGQKRGFEAENDLPTTQSSEDGSRPDAAPVHTTTNSNDESHEEESESQVLKRAKLSNTDKSNLSATEKRTSSIEGHRNNSDNIENHSQYGSEEGPKHSPSYVPATLAALPRSAAPPERANVSSNRNYEPPSGMRMSVSAILSKSGKDDRYRSKQMVDDQASRGQSLPPIGQTSPNPPSPYNTFHSRSSSHPLIEDPNRALPPRKFSHPTSNPTTTSDTDTQQRLVEGLLASAQPEGATLSAAEGTSIKQESPVPPKADAAATAASNLLGSAIVAVATAQAAATQAGSDETAEDPSALSSNFNQMLSANDQTLRRASLSNIISSDSPNVQEQQRTSLTNGTPAKEEEEEDTEPLPKPKLIIKNEQVWKSLEGIPEKSLGVFVYEPGVQLPVLENQENAILEVRIPSWCLTYENKMVKKRALWGTDIYTDDSDIVAMILHTGQYDASYQEPQVKLNSDVLLAMSGTAAVVEPRRLEMDKNIPDHDVSVMLRVLPKLQRYTSTIRHHLKSRQWGGNHDGMSIYVEKVELLPRGEARAKGRGALKSGLFAYQDLRRRAIANEKHSSTEHPTKHTTDDDQDDEPDANSRNRGVRKRIKMFQVNM
ncbi:hypothetical protein NQZ79_g1434 [Umbelopsis isabellina]|nr:hypothetical protein NQZ79_g1434 [Umbelopsis isabellina]